MLSRPGRVPRGFSLRDRLLLFTLGVAVVLLALTLGIIDGFLRQQIRREASSELTTTAAVFDRFLQLRAGWIRGQTQVVAEDPRFSATLDLPGADPATLARTVLGEARSFQNLLGSELFITTDAQGRTLARLELARAAAVETRQDEDSAERWTVDGIDYLVTSIGTINGDDLHVGVLPGERVALDRTQLRDLLATVPAVDAAADLLGWLDADLAAHSVAGSGPTDVVVRHVTSGADLSTWPAVRDGLRGRPWEGLHTEGGRLYHVDVVPVWSPDRLVGTLVSGFEIDDALASELRDMTRSHVSFFDPDGQLVASTWTGAARDSVALQLPSAIGGETFEIDVGGQTYLSRGGAFGSVLPQPGSSENGTYLIQRSLDSAFAFLRMLQEILLGVGVIVLAIAAAVSFLGARRLTQPVVALVEGTRRLAAGDLEHRIVEQSRSELGELAESFNDMAGALSRSRDALQESERAYRDLFDNAQDLVFTTDLSHRLRTVNRAGLAYLGFSAQQLQGRSLFDLVTPEQRDRVSEVTQAVAPGQPRPHVEASLLRADGSEVTLEIVSRWIVESGQTVGIHAIGRDITQRRERERATIRFREQLAQAEKLRALGEMASGVAHNFNNLLTVVVGNAELISLHENIPEPIRRDTELILESARRCSAIVRRIQTFGRPIDMDDVDQVDLCQVARDIVDLTRPKWRTEPALAGRQVDIVLDLQPLPPILSQGSAWEEILSNLIFNSVDAMPDGGTITITARLEGTEAVLDVRDTGTGMDEETKRRIFEPFFSTKDEASGTGLGLSTVWGLINTLGGSVAVDSRPGEGTCFSLRMPVADAMALADDEPQRPKQSMGQGLRVLVVDDEPRVLELVPPILRDCAVVDTAADGGQGLRRLAEAEYDVVLSDWVMAEASGLEVAAEAKSRYPQAVVILMTGWDPGSSAPDQDAVDLRLAKPFEREDVARVLDEAFTLHHQRRAANQASATAPS